MQSDFYAYSFKNKWLDNYSKPQGLLIVDTIKVPYTLEKDLFDNRKAPKSEDVGFVSGGSSLNGTIWYPDNSKGNPL
ncbi:hypothetical protein DN53_13190 [Flagellimonas olearia]|uniref:Uncharacterized protein n=1 Tax=Flagellimonas olearia TaxID=552546 RepID=A0A444VLU2_9FLAO|nr:hypothetical protein DN53_13190 [Allomuricauda olearia]